MLRSASTFVLVWILLGLPSPALAEESAGAITFQPEIRPEQMRPHIEFLASPALEGRESVAAKTTTRQYIVDQWKQIGLRPLFAESPAATPDDATPAAVEQAKFEQMIPGAKAADGTIPVMGYNVGAWIPGSDPELADEIVILSAHYDHLGVRNGFVYAGADDNASGVAMLIEAARQVARQNVAPRRTMVFLAFDLEERLLWGSRWFAAHPPWPIERVRLFVTADMISRSLGDLPLPVVFVFGSERAPELRAALRAVGTPPDLEVCRLGTDIVGTRSDYGTFRDREIPYLFFSTGEHPDYHTPNDTPDRVDYDKSARIASLMLRVTRHIADQPTVPTWSTPNLEDLEEPRVLNRITALLLEADQVRPLTSTQRFLVTNVRNRSRQILEADTMTADDRVWLVRMSQLLLASVF